MSTWAQQIQQRRQATIDAMAAEEQVVRDAHADGVTPTDIAAAYGTRSRERIYAILKRDPAAPQRPTVLPTIYLRGAGCKQATWDRVEHAMWARGWDTTHDRTTAWHRARGGLTVVLCDFTPGMTIVREDNDEELDQSNMVRVGLVRARYGTGTSGGQELELPLVNGKGWHRRPENNHVLDEERLARLVAAAIGS